MSDETKHSPEPWHVKPDSSAMIVDAKGRSAAEGWARSGMQYASDFDAACEANARRAVACVNALAGIPTEALESGALQKALDVLTRVQFGPPHDESDKDEPRPRCPACGARDVDIFHAPDCELSAALRALGRLL